MNNILIINLLRFGDIYSSIHIINSLKSKYPKSKITMLVYSEFLMAAKSIKGIAKIHVIDRKSILSITQNKLFSDGMALDNFIKSIHPLQKTEWDNVINYSNDSASAYLTSLLSKKKFSGIKYSKTNNVQHSSEWAILFNDVLTEFKYSNLHYVDCYHLMSGLKHTPINDSSIIKTNQTHNETAHRTFENIRKSYSNTNAQAKLIGIQLTTSDEKKNIPFNVIVELLDKIISENNMVPVLLVSQSSSESQLADNINKNFNNALIVVEADLTALPSVISNLDAIITPDTVTKHIADLLSTPFVEVALGSAPFRKQGGYNGTNIVVAPTIKCYPCSAKQSCSCETKHLCQQVVKSSDIFTALKCIFVPKLLQLASPSNQVCLYIQKQDMLGTYHIPAVGHINYNNTLSHELFRQYVIHSMNKSTQVNIPTSVYKNIPLKAVMRWSQEEKEACTNTSKCLLGTIRSLTLLTPNSIKKVNDFVESLEKLITYCSSSKLIAVPVLIFRAKLESLEQGTETENYKKVERLLYELKNNIQLLISCLTTLEYQTNKRDQEISISKVKSLRTRNPLANNQLSSSP